LADILFEQFNATMQQHQFQITNFVNWQLIISNTAIFDRRTRFEYWFLFFMIPVTYKLIEENNYIGIGFAYNICQNIDSIDKLVGVAGTQSAAN
jgi:hypothetical protein